MNTIQWAKNSFFLVKFFFVAWVSVTLIACASNNPSPKTTQKTSTIVVSSNTIPTPSAMKADVIASGRVSTLKHIDIAHVGKQIPYTYSDGKINNTPGFDWWVSKHFALKSDQSEENVIHNLELLEMSYPHYIELFGSEPPNIENQRIAVVFATDRDMLEVSMHDDGFRRGIHDTAGGETMFWNRAGYNFPSSRISHRRYIIIHETAHAFQMAVMKNSSLLPTWFVEGTADALAHSSYDPIKKQLKYMIFDRAIGSYLKMGLNQYAELKQPTIADMTHNPQNYRGINFLIVHFMLDDPRRSHLFKAYRDEMTRLNISNRPEKSIEVLQTLFGDFAQLEKEFAEYVANIDRTIQRSYGPWEQDGNAYWTRYNDYAKGHKNEDGIIHWVHSYRYKQGTPRIDFDLKLNEKPKYHPFKMDHPIGEPSPLLGNISRGTDTPSVGIEIGFTKDHLHRGSAGIALAVLLPQNSLDAIEKDKSKKRSEALEYDNDLDENYRIYIETGDTLVFDATRLGGERLAYPLPTNLSQSLQQQENPKLGLTIRVEEKSLTAILMTHPQNILTHHQSVAISDDLKSKILNRPIAIISKDTSHHITPYFDDGRNLNPHPRDLTQSAPANTFANPADKYISRLIRANWRLSANAPQVSLDLANAMINASNADPNTQLESIKNFVTQRNAIAAAIASSQSDTHTINHALAELAGSRLTIEWDKQQSDGQYPINVILRNPSDAPLSGILSFEFIDTNGQAQKIQSDHVNIKPGQQHRIHYLAAKPNEDDKTSWKAHATLQWAEQTFTLNNRSEYPYHWSTMNIIEPAHIENGEIKIGALLRGPLAGKTDGQLIIEVQPSNIVENSPIVEDLTIEPYERKKFHRSFKLKPGANTQGSAVLVRFNIEPDGEAIWLQERSLLNPTK